MLSPNYTYKAKVINIVDGDTIDVEIDLGFKLTKTDRLRLARINTAEIRATNPEDRAKAIEAKSFIALTLPIGAQVIIITKKSDAFGRYLAEVYINETNISDLMLELGHAVLYK